MLFSRLTPRAQDVAAVVAVIALKIGAMVYALHCGFAQVSDDDYARTVIAETFAHAPSLDPSGTSWLPFPFWLYGGVMMVFGRSLAVARALAFVLGAISPALTYAGLRAMGNARGAAFVGTMLASLTPWSVWLGLAPVPGGWAGACAAAALFFLASRAPRHTIVAGGLVLVSSLSRYEAWPVAALVTAVGVARGVRQRDARGAFVAGATLAAIGPMLWLAHNAYSHGDSLHFLARVAAFRRANAGVATVGERVLEYPLALVREAPEVVAAGIVGLVATGLRRDDFKRWRIPLGGAALVLAFLIYGDVHDGAPTHHPARALLTILKVLAGFGGAGVVSFAHMRGARLGLGAAAIAWISFVGLRTRAVPGASATERREAQIERGRTLASSVGTLDVTPCAYEHFALIAAFGTPERVVIEQSTHAPVTPTCPGVAFH